ncbi:hypothetical protein ABZ330_25010 [Streptomyces sp. NPDC006172]|uniref:hypothetical protein n=1 Tax=Streptomyces sp. NPDC006172 TaxID=3154470 RepID=UPI0033C4F64D
MRELRRRGRRGARSALALTLLLAAVLSGCALDDDEEGMGDAPVRGKAGEDTPAEVYNFPDGFGNLATKCVGTGKRSYVTTKYVTSDGQSSSTTPANAVIVDDPTCP